MPIDNAQKAVIRSDVERNHKDKSEKEKEDMIAASIEQLQRREGGNLYSWEQKELDQDRYETSR